MVLRLICALSLCDLSLAVISVSRSQATKTYQKYAINDTIPAPHGAELLLNQDAEYQLQPVHTKEWFLDQCAAIKLRCESRIENLERTWGQKIHRLEEEYKSKAKLLCESKDAEQDAEDSVIKHASSVTTCEEELHRAEVVYQESRTCVSELRIAEDELEELESGSDESSNDIRAECLKKKEILEKKQCVHKNVEAAASISRRKRRCTTTKRELTETKSTVNTASEDLEEFAVLADEARIRLEQARSEGYSKYLKRIHVGCKHEMSALLQRADAEVATAQTEYREHARIYDHREEKYEEKTTTIKTQKTTVVTEKLHVQEALERYSRLKHCPVDLEKAEEELEQLQATPDKSEDDIDDECYKKEEILKIRVCVEDYYEAKDVLTRTRSLYEEEMSELEEDERTATKSITSVQRYERLVKRYEREWQAASRSRNALVDCAGDLLQEKTITVPGSATEDVSGSGTVVDGSSAEDHSQHSSAFGTRLAAFIPVVVGMFVFF